MSFEKMRASELYEKFKGMFPQIATGMDSYEKIGARALKLHMQWGEDLYFLWYDDHNWNFGTKMYRNRPKKQLHKEVKYIHADAETWEKHRELRGQEMLNLDNTESSGVITGCNQRWGDVRPSDLVTNGNDPLRGDVKIDLSQTGVVQTVANQAALDSSKEIEWIKEDPDGRIHTTTLND